MNQRKHRHGLVRSLAGLIAGALVMACLTAAGVVLFQNTSDNRLIASIPKERLAVWNQEKGNLEEVPSGAAPSLSSTQAASLQAIGALCFDQSGYTVPLLNIPTSGDAYDTMLYGAVVLTAIDPTDKQTAIVLASHTQFIGRVAEPHLNFGDLHETEVGESFTLSYFGHYTRRYRVVSVGKALNPQKADLSALSGEGEGKTLRLTTCLSYASSTAESRVLPRLVVTAIEESN